MNQNSQSRLAAFQRRHPGRENLTSDALYERHFASDALPREECEEVLALLGEELAIPSGLLRPEDEMVDILEPFHSRNPLRWIEEWTRAADGKAELNDRLRSRLEAAGTLSEWQDLPTVGDVVRAWCGRLPTH